MASSVNGQTQFWLQVFSNSKVNGALYLGNHLPSNGWDWPTEYLQRLFRANVVGATASCSGTESQLSDIPCAPERVELGARRNTALKRNTDKKRRNCDRRDGAVISASCR